MNRKKLLIIIIGLLMAQALSAQDAWTVRTVPNTRLQGNEIHVSDPDGYLSDSTEAYINEALSAIRSQADVFLVTLNSIGDDDPKHFATSLFNYWGIGDAETDNGVLLLFVEDQHALEFETGYGAEQTLTDARCSRIFNGTIVPYFKAGDYEGGLCAGVADIVEVYGGEVPDGLMSNLTSRNNGDGNEGNEEDFVDSMSMFGVLFFLFVLLPVPFISFVRWLVGLVKKNKKNDESSALEVRQKGDIKYFDLPTVNSDFSVWTKKGFMRFLLYGVSLVVIYLLAVDFVPDFMPDAALATQDAWATGITLFAYLSLTCIVQNVMELRKADALAIESTMPKSVYKKALNDSHSMMARILAPWMGFLFGNAFRRRVAKSGYCCPTCGMQMESVENPTLSKEWNVEQEIGAYQFSTFRCPSGHRFVVREHGNSYSKYINCKSCGAHAAKLVSEKIWEPATYAHAGSKELTYSCQCCQKSFIQTKSIPRLVHSSSSGSSSYSRGGGYRSSGGSFGGGRSGGGGFSGRW